MDPKERYLDLTGNGDILFVSGRIDPRNKTIFAFKEVLDNFSTAKQIRVATYTISVFQDYLLKLLYDAEGVKDFKIVVGSPSFYNHKSKINQYGTEITRFINLLEKESFKSPVQIGINAFNHAKMIGTENVLYIGSQNYSHSSREKFDAGVIIRNPDIIKKIYESGFEEIWDNSYIIRDDDASKKLLETYIMLSEVIQNIENHIASIYVEKIDSDSFEYQDEICVYEYDPDYIKTEIINCNNHISSLDKILERPDIDDIISAVEGAFSVLPNTLNIVEDAISDIRSYSINDLISTWMIENKGMYYDMFYEEAKAAVIENINAQIDTVNEKLKTVTEELYECYKNIEDAMNLIQGINNRDADAIKEGLDEIDRQINA